MRVRAIWSIENEHSEDVFVGFYVPGDTVYAATIPGGGRWVEPGESIFVEVDFDECQIVFWKSKPVVGTGTKLAGPVRVTTDRTATLTANFEVVQRDEAEFDDPERVEAVVFMTAMEFNNTLRSVVLTGLGKIPQVGGAISAVIDVLWSEEKVDLIAVSEARMRRWVQGRFEEHDLELLAAKLSGLRRLLDEYANASDLPERARWFDACLAACEQALPFFTERDFVPGTTALASALGTIHLTLLRERVVHPQDIFDDKHVNMARFKASLRQTTETYQDHILNVAVPGDLKARLDRIEEIDLSTSPGTGPIFLRDFATREVHRFRHSAQANSQQKQDPRVCVEYYLEQAKGSLARQLQENLVHTALLWTLLDPDRQHEHPIPLDGVTWNAALAGLGYMYGNTHLHAHNDAQPQRFGRIDEIVVQEDGAVLGLHFKGDAGDGGHTMETRGHRHVVKVPPGAFLTRVETWFDYDLFGIRFHFSDGSAQGPFGAHTRGEVHQIAEFPLHHITAIGVGQRMQELRCGFTPLPDYYERLAAG